MGRFFVKTPADRPIRFALLDEKGAVVRQEHGWFWIRARRAAHLRGLPHGPGARIGESCAGGAAAHDNAGRFDRREAEMRAKYQASREATEMMIRFLLFSALFHCDQRILRRFASAHFGAEWQATAHLRATQPASAAPQVPQVDSL